MRKAVLLSYVVCGLLTATAGAEVKYSVYNLSAAWDAEFEQPEIVQTWYATAINNSGQIAGSAFKVDNKSFALTWDSDSGLRDFLDIEETTHSYCINNLGQIAIHGYPTSYLWDENNGLQQITGWGSGPLSPSDINDLGQVVGVHWPDNNLEKAFFWDGGNAREIGIMGGEEAGVTAVNNLGQVVGWSGSASRADAFLWDSINCTVSIGTEFYASIARDINDHGQIIGNAQFEEGGDWRAVLWVGDGVINIDAYAGGTSQPTAINNLGQVIGDMRMSLQERFPYIWDINNGMQNLNDLIPESDWIVREIYDINDNGWIIGVASNEVLQQNCQVLLKPVPEPSCLFLIISTITIFSFNLLLSHHKRSAL